MYRLDSIPSGKGLDKCEYEYIIWYYNDNFTKADLTSTTEAVLVNMATNEKQIVSMPYLCSLMEDNLLECQQTSLSKMQVPTLSEDGYQLSKRLEFIGLSVPFNMVNGSMLYTELSNNDLGKLSRILINDVSLEFSIDYKSGCFDNMDVTDIPHNNSIVCRHGWVIDSLLDKRVPCNIYDFMLENKKNVIFLDDGTLGVVIMCSNAVSGEFCLVKFKYDSRVLLEFM